VRRPVGNPKDICVKEAKAAHVKALADARVDRVAADERHAGSDKTMATRREAAEDKRDADYNVAIEKCDALAVPPRTTASETRGSVTASRRSRSSPAGGAQTSSMRLTGSLRAGIDIPAFLTDPSREASRVMYPS